MGPGSRIGRFEVEETLGQGGIATVYRVRHSKLDTHHALKILKISHSGLARRLLQEGRIQARLHHPNVVAVTDVIEDGGHIGLLMELVDGFSLEDCLAGEPMDREEALDIFKQVLEGVAAAHAAGVTHRDLKPGNVLLTTRGDRVLAKVTDFGIAKVFSEEGSPSMTRAGATMGTPGYMAPEQMRNSAGVDHRADIFALGAILYEMLSGRPAFREDDMLASLTRVAQGRFTPLQDLVPDLPGAIAEAVARAMQPDVDDRFADCAAFAQAIYGEGLALPAPSSSLMALDGTARDHVASRTGGAAPTLAPSLLDVDLLEGASSTGTFPDETFPDETFSNETFSNETFSDETFSEDAESDDAGLVRRDLLRRDLLRRDLLRRDLLQDEPDGQESTQDDNSTYPERILPADFFSRVYDDPSSTMDLGGTHDEDVDDHPTEDVLADTGPAALPDLLAGTTPLGTEPPDIPPIEDEERDDPMNAEEAADTFRDLLGTLIEATLWALVRVLRYGAFPALALIVFTWWVGVRSSYRLEQLAAREQAAEASLRSNMDASVALVPAMVRGGADEGPLEAARGRYLQADDLDGKMKAAKELSSVMSVQLARMPPAETMAEREERRRVELALARIDQAMLSYESAAAAHAAESNSLSGRTALLFGMVEEGED